MSRSCSAAAAALGEPMAGTAPQALGWVALEQNGPWGARALTASHLDPAVGAALESAAAAVGVRPALIRSPGRHPDVPAAGHRVLVAHTRPAATWLLEGSVADPAELLGLDWAAVARGDAEAVRSSAPALTPSTRPHLLVCTNGTRDLCCAVAGRPVAVAAAAAAPADGSGGVWETTHTSGHRFAPTAVLLPSGVLYGRLQPASAAGVLAAAARGEVVVGSMRGRSTWPPAGQAAEVAVRAATGETGLDVLTVEDEQSCWRVRHRDGRMWEVGVEEVPGAARPESCGRPAVPIQAFSARVLDTAG